MNEIAIDRALAQLPLFAELTPDELSELRSIGRFVQAPAGAKLLRQGDSAGGMSVVLEGEVRIILDYPDGEREALASLTRGDTVGELSLVDNSPRSATAYAQTDTTVFLIDRAEFDRLRRNFRPVAYKIIRAIGPVVCQRLRAANWCIANRLSEQARSASDADDRGES